MDSMINTYKIRIYWLVVDLPLWKTHMNIWVRQLGWWHSQLNGNKMFQTINQLWIFMDISIVRGNITNQKIYENLVTPKWIQLRKVRRHHSSATSSHAFTTDREHGNIRRNLGMSYRMGPPKIAFSWFINGWILWFMVDITIDNYHYHYHYFWWVRPMRCNMM